MTDWNLDDILYPGSHLRNMRDARDRGRLKQPNVAGERNAQAKLTEAQVREIRAVADADGSISHFAKLFGVSAGAIRRIASRRSWRALQ